MKSEPCVDRLWLFLLLFSFLDLKTFQIGLYSPASVISTAFGSSVISSAFGSSVISSALGSSFIRPAFESSVKSSACGGVPKIMHIQHKSASWIPGFRPFACLGRGNKQLFSQLGDPSLWNNPAVCTCQARVRQVDGEVLYTLLACRAVRGNKLLYTCHTPVVCCLGGPFGPSPSEF